RRGHASDIFLDAGQRRGRHQEQNDGEQAIPHGDLRRCKSRTMQRNTSKGARESRKWCVRSKTAHLIFRTGPAVSQKTAATAAPASMKNSAIRATPGSVNLVDKYDHGANPAGHVWIGTADALRRNRG